MNRTLAIGDIHGGLKALQEVLEKAAVKKDNAVRSLLASHGYAVASWRPERA
jgi:hypothetical protein